MSKPVKIQFLAIQEADGERAEITQSMDGERYDKDGEVFLHFKEEADDIGTITSLMRIKGETVRITRKGGVKTTMEFKAGQDCMCEYQMPVGKLSFVISTEFMELTVKETEISMDLVYDMFSFGEQVSRNTLEMRVTDQ